MSRCNLGAILLALALLFGAQPALAAESYDNCTGFITSLPAVISTQGTWCLKNDLTTAMSSGNAIVISTNNVTIDCNDFKLGGLAAGAGTTANGIFALDRLNATIRHCNVRGFFIGIYFAGSVSGGHAVEDNRFDGNTGYSMFVQGDGSVVRRNRVFDTGASSGNADAYGIVAIGSVDVLDNTVSGVVARSGGGGSAFGIDASGNLDARIQGNSVRGLAKDGAGSEKGIFATSSDRISVSNNAVVGTGAATGAGITCSTANGSARDNVISGFVTALASCTDSGGNTIVP